ncbi:MAG: FecR family protein, partial [Thermodesulfobacteriota bacterium]
MKNLIAFLLCLGIALALPGVALAQKVGSLTVVQGTVDLLPGGKAAHAAKLGETVQVGDTVRTRKEGRAEITFDDGTIVRVARSTELAITKFLINDKQTDARINLPRGKIQSIVPRKVGQIFGQQEANRFEVKTPTATCGVRGTDFFTYHQNGLSGATFKEGQGYFFNNKMPDLVSLVSAGQSVTITGPDGKPV